MNVKPQWFTIYSVAMAQFMLSDLYEKDGQLTMTGPLQVFFDEPDAEKWCDTMRMTHPMLGLEVVPLPAEPDVLQLARRTPAGLKPDAALKYYFVATVPANADAGTKPETLQIEMRPMPGSQDDAFALAVSAHQLFREIPNVRLGPLLQQSFDVLHATPFNVTPKSKVA
jgi:hypothetical protein